MPTHPRRTFFIALAICISAAGFITINSYVHWVSDLIAVPFAGVIPPAVIWSWWVRRRAFRYIRNHHYHVCSRCLYPLAEVRAPTCPECGTPFTLPDLVTYWATVEEETDWSKGD